ncbi:hypothetical protein MRB53_036863 [Persea americana]|nr:hypothetical protein MRB53_036863 [Persea americana]
METRVSAREPQEVFDDGEMVDNGEALDDEGTFDDEESQDDGESLDDEETFDDEELLADEQNMFRTSSPAPRTADGGSSDLDEVAAVLFTARDAERHRRYREGGIFYTTTLCKGCGHWEDDIELVAENLEGICEIPPVSDRQQIRQIVAPREARFRLVWLLYCDLCGRAKDDLKACQYNFTEDERYEIETAEYENDHARMKRVRKAVIARHKMEKKDFNAGYFTQPRALASDAWHKDAAERVDQLDYLDEQLRVIYWRQNFEEMIDAGERAMRSSEAFLSTDRPLPSIYSPIPPSFLARLMTTQEALQLAIERATKRERKRSADATVLHDHSRKRAAPSRPSVAYPPTPPTDTTPESLVLAARPGWRMPVTLETAAESQQRYQQAMRDTMVRLKNAHDPWEVPELHGGHCHDTMILMVEISSGMGSTTRQARICFQERDDRDADVVQA